MSEAFILKLGVCLVVQYILSNLTCTHRRAEKRILSMAVVWKKALLFLVLQFFLVRYQSKFVQFRFFVHRYSDELCFIIKLFVRN